jgi:tetratricopeptide (TPR) repeat protein
MRRRVVAWQLVVLALIIPAAARAQGEPADCAEQDPTACGRRHFEAGTRAFERGDYAEASVEFQTALAQRPHLVVRFNLALSLLRLGQPSAALAELAQVLNDPATEKDLRERATREQRSAEQALSHITFRLSDPTRERVELDRKLVDLAVGQELALDPGNHHVRVISNSSVVLDQELDLGLGERLELRVGERSRRIDVVVVPTAPAVVPLVVKRPPAEARTEPKALTPAWFYAGVGATAVLTGLTVWSGIDTNKAYSRYEHALPKLTQAAADERVESGHARELRTNLLLAGSLVCGAGTAVLGIWFVDFSGKSSASVGLSPGRVALSGRF